MACPVVQHKLPSITLLMRCYAGSPILPFTAQEAWQVMMDKNSQTSDVSQKYIFTQEYYDFPEFELTAITVNDWKRILQAKEAVNKAIETAREQKIINANLSASVTIYASGDMHASLAKLGDELRFVLITSGAIASTS